MNELIQSKRMNEQYEKIEHSSGLTIYLYPKNGFSTDFAMFGTKYGSIDNRFRRSDEPAAETVPEGIAHFLEHKLFESEDGDAFARFAQTGASANAFTSFESTAYLFSCTDNLYESLEILLDFVQSPYFTKETIEKEQGIIGQEIKMYDDDPQWRVMTNYLRAMYHTHPIRLDIAGTVESIAQITPEHLYRCYQTFYNLNNMALVLVGDFDRERVLQVCDATLRTAEPVSVQRVFDTEPSDVLENKVEDALSVALPLFQFGYKEHVDEKPIDEKNLAAMEVLLEILASDCSPLYQSLLTEGLINETSFGFEYFEGTGFATVMFSGESQQPEEVADRICKEVERLRRDGLSEEAFFRAKRSIYGSNVSIFNSTAEIANCLLSFHLKGRELFTYLDALAELTMEDVLQKLDVLHPQVSVLSVIRPLEQ